MEYIYSIFLGNSHLGDVHKVGEAYILFFSKVHNGSLNKIHFDFKVEEKGGEIFKMVPDEPLRTLSTQPYILNFKDEMIYEGDVYETRQLIPSCCRYMAIPAIDIFQIVDYDSTCAYDKLFIYEGYVNELSKAKYVLIPNCSYEDLSDLLIEKVEGDTYYSFNGRYTTIKGRPTSKYVQLSTCPEFSGERKNTPFTYTPCSIIAKYQSMNERLEKYGSSKVASICRALQCVCGRLMSETNQFEASQSYDDVVKLVRSLQ